MNETPSIGLIIKQLRKERKLTQQELAEQLNVTTQAVSKWESGAGMPDISQVVPLANAFGVSLDVLFGTANANDAEIDRIIERIEEPVNRCGQTGEGDHIELIRQAWAEYQEALKLYPNNTKLLLCSICKGSMDAMHYGWYKENEKADEIRAEVLREANLVVNYSRDVNEIMKARRYLVSTYAELGQFDKAEEQAAYFPWAQGYSRGHLLAEIYTAKGDRKEEICQRCDNITYILEDLYIQIMFLGNAYYYSEGKKEDSYRVYRSIYDIYTAIFKDEPIPFDGLVNIYELTAISCVELGRPEEAIDWLRRIYDLMKQNEPRYETEFHPETPLMREHKIYWSENKNAARDRMLFSLNLTHFDPIREMPRFRELQKKAEAMGE